MSNIEKYNKAFMESLEISEEMCIRDSPYPQVMR